MKLFRFSKNSKKRRLAAMLATCLFITSLSGCGKQAEPVPELMEPLAATEVYRPVVRGSIGDIYILNGIIVPEKYPVYTDKQIEIASINVTPGDYVNQGDVIATGNTKNYDRQLSDLNSQLNLLRLERSTSEKISIKNEEKLNYKKCAAEAVGYDEEAAEYAKAILIERENRRFNLATLDAQIRQINEQMVDIGDDKNELVFTAPHSGYISFVKDLSDTNSVEGSENIAVVADYDNLHIEVPSVPYNKYLFRNYEEKYTIQNGEKFVLTEYEYDPKELGYADTLLVYPPIRFNLGGIKGEMGSMVPLYFKRFSHSDVLMVGKDSIYLDNEIYYVYVKGEDGQREKRQVEIGATDSLNYEIKSGLKEGELVFYENMAPLPANYTEHEIVLGDYEEVFESDTAKNMLTNADIYISECKGMIKDLAFVSSGVDIGEGQELIRIGTDPQSGKIADLKNQLADLSAGYNNTVKAYDEQEKADKEAIEAAKTFELPEEPKLEDVLKKYGIMEDPSKETKDTLGNSNTGSTENTAANQGEQNNQGEKNTSGEKNTQGEKNSPEAVNLPEKEGKEPEKSDEDQAPEAVIVQQDVSGDTGTDEETTDTTQNPEKTPETTQNSAKTPETTQDPEKTPETTSVPETGQDPGTEQPTEPAKPTDPNQPSVPDSNTDTEQKNDPEKDPEGEEEPDEVLEQAMAEYEALKKEYTDLVRDSMYVTEIMEADLEIISLNRTLQSKKYEVQKSNINEELSEYQTAGSGVDVVYTGRNAGKSGKVNLSTNTSVEKGQYLFTVMTEGTKLLKVVMKKETDPSKPEGGVAKIGQKVEVSINGQVYYGKCVGENGNCENTNGIYLFSRNGAEHLTTSKPYAEGGPAQFFIKMDDEKVYDMIPDSPAEADQTKLNVQFRGSEIHGATVVPVKGLYNEKDQANAAAGTGDRYYVWKITDQGLVKQYVVLYETKVISENKLVLSGLSEGDKIAIEGK